MSRPAGPLFGEPIDPNAGPPQQMYPSAYGPPQQMYPSAYGPPQAYPPTHGVGPQTYPPAYGVPAGYPGYGYPPASTRPSNVVGASVLGYIAAGILALAALLLFLGASVVTSFNDNGTADGYGAELAVDGVIDVVIAVLLITGAAMLTGRRLTGRVLLTIASVLCAGAGVYWAVRVPTQGVAFYVILFVSLPVVAATLAWTPSASQWLADPPPAGRPNWT